MTFYNDTVLADSPLVYLKLDETSGSTVADSGSTGGTATVGAGVTLNQTGINGGGKAISTAGGTTSYVSKVVSGTPFADKVFSVEWWQKGGANSKDVGEYYGSGAGYGVIIDGSGKLKFTIYGGTTSAALTSTTTVTGSTWHHIVFTANGNSFKLYVDGNLEASSTTNIGTFAPSATLYVGSYQSTAAAASYDEFALYDAELSSTRITAHKNAGVTTPVNGGYSAQVQFATADFPGGTKVKDNTYTATAMTASATTPNAVGGVRLDLQASRDWTTNEVGVVNTSTTTLAVSTFGNGSPDRYAVVDFELPSDFGSVTLDSAQLQLTVTTAFGGTGDFAVQPILAEYTTGQAQGFTFGPEVTATKTGTGTVSVDVTSVITKPFYGFRIISKSGSGAFASVDNATTGSRPVLTVSYHYEVVNASVGATPMTASADVPNAGFSISDGYAASAMGASASMPTSTVSVVAQVSVSAEPMEALGLLGNSGFAVPVTVSATAVTASAEVVSPTATTTRGVAYTASPMGAQAQWVQASAVNGQPIETNETEDRYFQRVSALGPDTWLRLNDKGSLAKDRVTSATIGSYVGVQVGQFAGPENRASVHFDGTGMIDTNEGGPNVDEITLPGDYALEFSFRTDKANTFLMIGQDSVANNTQTTAAAATELKLVGGKIRLTAYRFGPTFTQSVFKEFTGQRNLADGQWHHVVVRTVRSENTANGSGVEIWVDGTFEIRRYGVANFVGFPDYIGGRPDYIEFGSNLPTLPLNDWFVGDMSEVVWYDKTALDGTSIPRNYYAFMGWKPVEAGSFDAFAFTPAGSSGKGNQKRALALSWRLGINDYYNRQVIGGTGKMNFDPLPMFDRGVTEYMGYKVFGVGVMDGNPAGGNNYRDPITDDVTLINLETDVNLNDYDLIMVQDWPDEGDEIEAIDRTYPGARERLTQQIKNAVTDKGINLFVSHPRLAIDLGIVDRVEFVPTLGESKLSAGQGNAAGLYDYGSAYKFPWNIAGGSGMTSVASVGSPFNGVPANRDPSFLAAKAYFYGDSNKNDRFRVRALIEGLTDIPSYMIQDAVFQVDYDPWGWQGVAYKYLHRLDGLHIGDEYIYHGTDYGLTGGWMDGGDYIFSRANGTVATPPGHVKAGTIVTTFGAKYWQGTQEVDNPYKDYATTIVLKPGDSLGGKAIAGKVFVNFSEQPSQQPEGVVIQVLPAADNNVYWPGLYKPDTAEQREWEWSYTRQTLSSTSGFNNQNVTFIDPLGNQVTITANAGSDLTMVRSKNLFPLAGAPLFQMVRRGLVWLMDRTEQEPGAVTVRAEAMTATAAAPNAAVVAERDADVNATSMVAVAAMPKVAEDQSGDAQVVTLPMTAAATWTGYGKTISAAPMLANAEFVEDFDAVHTSGEQVVLTLPHADAVLYLKEEE